MTVPLKALFLVSTRRSGTAIFATLCFDLIFIILFNLLSPQCTRNLTFKTHIL